MDPQHAETRQGEGAMLHVAISPQSEQQLAQLQHQSQTDAHNGVQQDRSRAAVKRQIMALAGVRSWLRLAPDGACTTVQLERHALEKELGVQLRDFRVLDAVLGTSYPACILVSCSIPGTLDREPTLHPWLCCS
jgi:hypothetical protein